MAAGKGRVKGKSKGRMAALRQRRREAGLVHKVVDRAVPDPSLGDKYLRYQDTESGVAPMSAPGEPTLCGTRSQRIAREVRPEVK